MSDLATDVYHLCHEPEFEILKGGEVQVHHTLRLERLIRNDELYGRVVMALGNMALAQTPRPTVLVCVPGSMSGIIDDVSEMIGIPYVETIAVKSQGTNPIAERPEYKVVSLARKLNKSSSAVIVEGWSTDYHSVSFLLSDNPELAKRATSIISIWRSGDITSELPLPLEKNAVITKKVPGPTPLRNNKFRRVQSRGKGA